MKKIIMVLCLAGLVLASAGCGKNEEKYTEQTPAPVVVEQDETEVDEGIENGGDIDDEGNVVDGSDEAEIDQEDGEEVGQKEAVGNVDDAVEIENSNAGNLDPSNQNAATQPQVSLEYDSNGNITKQSAVEILQKYTVEQLGLTPDVRHQLLFEEDFAVVNGKNCYTIAAKIEGGNTEGVFYVTVDGKTAYKYDLENQKYIKLP